MYPIEKYQYFYAGRKVIAVSTYAGKTVRGVAICDPNDDFSVTKGQELAAARCALKIANKRVKRASTKIDEAEANIINAQRHYDKMSEYLDDAWHEKESAERNLNEILADF